MDIFSWYISFRIDLTTGHILFNIFFSGGDLRKWDPAQKRRGVPPKKDEPPARLFSRLFSRFRAGIPRARNECCNLESCAFIVGGEEFTLVYNPKATDVGDIGRQRGSWAVDPAC